jgi:alkyl hydroperoxide reductase subunit F
MYDLIILGGGPAGLTAAIYALRRRLNTLLISKDLGGKTNYRQQLPNLSHHLVINGEEVVSRFANEVEYLDFARVLDTAERVEPLEGEEGYRVWVRGGQAYTARAILVATGANARRLNVPGEAEFLGRGVIYSAVSYASLFVDGVVAVVGDGPLALRSVAELAGIARRVTLVARTDQGLDTPLGQRLTSLNNVTVLPGYQVEAITGDHYARGLTVTRVANHNGHGAANGDSDRREISADAIFVELGLLPNVGLLNGLAALDANGRIMVDSRNRASRPGLFAAGDVTDVYAEQVLVAIGEGAKAALSAYDYLLEHPVVEAAPTPEWR